MEITDEDEINAILGITAPATNKPSKTPAQEIDVLAEKLISVRAQIDELKSLETHIEDAIWARTPEEVGEVAVEGDQYTFTVTRSELWKWDSDKLEQKIPTLPVPDHINVKYSVDKKKFHLLAKPEQDDLLDALERKPGAPRVRAMKKSDQPI